MPLPAERVLAADPPQLQAVGFLLILKGAIGHDRLPASLGAAHALTRAEQQAVAELRRHAVQEQPQRLVAALLAARLPLVGVLLVAGRDVGGALPLAAAVEVAGFGRVQAGVAVFFGVDAVEAFRGHREHPCVRVHKGERKLSDCSEPPNEKETSDTYFKRGASRLY